MYALKNVTLLTDKYVHCIQFMLQNQPQDLHQALTISSFHHTTTLLLFMMECTPVCHQFSHPTYFMLSSTKKLWITMTHPYYQNLIMYHSIIFMLSLLKWVYFTASLLFEIKSRHWSSSWCFCLIFNTN